jgi:hypothetical protein
MKYVLVFYAITMIYGERVTAYVDDIDGPNEFPQEQDCIDHALKVRATLEDMMRKALLNPDFELQWRCERNTEEK